MANVIKTDVHYKVGKYDVRLTGGTLRIPVKLGASMAFGASLVNWSYVNGRVKTHTDTKHPTEAEWTKINKITGIENLDLSKINNLTKPLSSLLDEYANKTRTNIFTGVVTVVTPTTNKQLATKGYLLDRLVKSGLYPPGRLILRPSGYVGSDLLLADGGYVSKVTYANLFGEVGDTYLKGGTKPNPATDFRLPNLTNISTPTGFDWYIKT